MPLPPNSDCRGAAVIAKASVVEDAAAANMLAEALREVSPRGDQRCLLDAGVPPDPKDSSRPPQPPSDTHRSSAGLARTLYVVGGPAALPDEWLTEQFGVTEFTRVAGADRWQTQENVAAAIVALANGQTVRSYSPAGDRPRGFPPNGDCFATAVLAKLSVAEERAAANMLAVALTAISGNSESRCLIDVGDPGDDRPPTAVAVADAAHASGVYLLGGEAAVPTAWIDDGFDIRFVERIAGADRWETQSLVAQTIIGISRGDDTLPHQFINDAGDSISVFSGYVASSRTGPAAGVIGPDGTVSYSVTIHHCGPESALETAAARRAAMDSVAEAVRGAEQYLTPFFEHQSSGRAAFEFRAADGLLVLPDGLGWDEAFNNNEKNISWQCYERLGDDAHGSYVLIDQPVDDITGWAFVGSPYGTQPTYARRAAGFWNTFAHEIGHGWLGLCHPHDQADYGCFKDHVELVYNNESAECGLMSYCISGSITTYDRATGLPVWIACGQRKLLGWRLDAPAGEQEPCDDSAPTSDAVPPSAPVVLAVPDDGEIRVSWAAARDRGSPVSGYTVSWFGGGENGSQLLDATARSYTITGLRNGTRYQVQIAAHSAAGSSEPTAVDATPTAPQPSVSVPDAPPPPLLSTRDNEMEVSWQMPADNGALLERYEVRWRPVLEGVWSDRSIAAPTQRLRIIALGYNTQYEVQVRARNSEGWGDWSSSASEYTEAETVEVIFPSVTIAIGNRNSRTSNCASPCHDLSYDIRGLGDAPYSMECWLNGQRVGNFRWSGRPSTSCYVSLAYRGTVYVVINGVRSNTVSF